MIIATAAAPSRIIAAMRQGLAVATRSPCAAFRQRMLYFGGRRPTYRAGVGQAALAVRPVGNWTNG